MTTPLQKSAQAVIARWNSPSWKDQPHTAEYIAELRKALNTEITQSVEPVAVFNGLVDSGEHGAFNLDMLKMIPRGAHLYLHPPQPNYGWLEAVDKEMVCAHLGVANITDTFDEANAKLLALINWHVAVATDPAVNGGLSLPPLPPSTLYDAGQCLNGHNNDSLRDYGQACREQALEEAAMAALEAPIKTHGQPLRQACANAIRRLK